MRTTPVWDERQFPTVQMSDLGDTGITYDSALHSLPGYDQDSEFLEWVNGHRLVVHQELERATPLLEERLATRGLQLATIAESVGRITHRPPYPTNRLQLLHHMQSSRAFQAAFEAVTPGLAFTDEDDIRGQYNPILGIILANNRYLHTPFHADIAHTLAENLGQAATGTIVNAYVQYEPNPAFRYWYGYQWWWRDERYGGAIQKASTEKIAALVRQELHIIAEGGGNSHPLLEPYRREEGYYYESGMAIVLDLINQRLGFDSDEPGVYELIWHFGQQGGDDSAHESLAEMVKYATHSAMTLEDLEAVPVRSSGMPLQIMQRVEEACQIDISSRPSRAFLERGAERTD